MTAANTFLYFAYGSNLLTQRIHIANPTAIRKAIGKLRGYRLDFNYFSQRWKGAAGTIVPDKKSHVWGAVWQLNNENMSSLDNQEGVHNGVYEVINVCVETPSGESMKCRCYTLIDQPPALKEGEQFPEERYPSKIYLDTIIKGAIESGIPDDYIKYLHTFPHNGFDGKVEYEVDD